MSPPPAEDAGRPGGGPWPHRGRGPDALAGIARFAGGALADDPGRRRSVAVGGYASTALLSSAISLAGAVWQVGVLRAGGWFTLGLRVPARKGAPGGRCAGHRFDGPVIVEPFNAGVRALPPPERVAAVAASLAAVWPG